MPENTLMMALIQSIELGLALVLGEKIKESNPTDLFTAVAMSAVDQGNPFSACSRPN